MIDLNWCKCNRHDGHPACMIEVDGVHICNIPNMYDGLKTIYPAINYRNID
jgi:hypothetical protein